jgi:ribonuclease HI
MLQHFEEYIAGVRYLICTYANGPSAKKRGSYRVVVYQMFGSDIEHEEADAEIGDQENHIQLELRAIETALIIIGETTHPIVFLTRQKYLADHAKSLRARGFKRTNGQPAANIDQWRRIEALDPNEVVEWRFAERDYDEMVEEWKAEKELAATMQNAIDRDPW